MPKIKTKQKQCAELNCTKQPSYNYDTSRTRLYCGEHKKDGMINVASKRCLHCTKIPGYNYKGCPSLYCKDHKRDGMIIVRCKLCQSKDCKKQCTFNHKDEKIPIYCGDHKLEGMVNIVTRRCLDCDKISVFNYIGEVFGLYCGQHKKDGMIDVKSDICLECFSSRSRR